MHADILERATRRLRRGGLSRAARTRTMQPRPDLLDRLADADGRTRAALAAAPPPDGRARRRPWLEVDGRRLLGFCSNDYLGLAQHPQLIAAFKRVADDEGVGSTAAHLVCGHRREHAMLEEALADWTGRERALLFSTGYAANLGALQALLGGVDGAVCVQDKLNHASLIDGARLAGATLKRYPHGDSAAAPRASCAGRAAVHRRCWPPTACSAWTATSHRCANWRRCASASTPR